MRPALVFDLLDGVVVSAGKVVEAQSMDTRPVETGIFITVTMEETTFTRGIRRGPRTMTIAVHQPWIESRDYDPLTDILNEIQGIFRIVADTTGSDGVRVTCLTPLGRGGNTEDEGWQTITRTATYGVLYDETAA